MMPDAGLEDRIARIEAQLAIQQLAARYARAVDSRNLADLGGLFSPQTNFGEHGSGEDGARAFYDRVLAGFRSEEHRSELQSLMRSSYAGFCLKKKRKRENKHNITRPQK